MNAISNCSETESGTGTRIKLLPFPALVVVAVLSLVPQAWAFSLSSTPNGRVAFHLKSKPPSLSALARTTTTTTTTTTTSTQRFSAEESLSSDLLIQQQQKQDETTTNAIKKHNFTVTFPKLSELETIQRGDFVASDPSMVNTGTKEHAFRVLLYPRGGGHSSSYTADKKQNNSNKLQGGFGMGYQMVPLFQRDDAVRDRVGVYLQYLPPQNTENNPSWVDATFNLRLKGQQTKGPRFDVDWTTGMRFVGPNQGNLREGTANDFGAHMMQSYLLEDFLGGDEANNNLQLEVSIQIHSPSTSTTFTTCASENSSVDNNNNNNNNNKPPFLSFEDIRKTADNNPNLHNAENVRVGKIVVPILQRLSQRPRLFQLGAYPGVEYRIMRILDPATGQDIFSSVPNADYELKPIYPLVPALERPWPVRVNERDLPKLYTMTMYNTVSALGSLLTALTALSMAFIISQLVSLFFIPSKSMDPTLRVGDVLVVEKVTPRLFQDADMLGDIILFHPNEKLQTIVQSSGGRITDRDLFVKRVAAGPGDYVSVDKTGSVTVNGQAVTTTQGKRDLCEEEPLRLIQRYITPVENQEVQSNQVFVLGDCSSVSVDSRVWGPLDKSDIVGKPLLRIWPLDRWGKVSGLVPADDDESSLMESLSSSTATVSSIRAVDDSTSTTKYSHLLVSEWND